MERYYVKKLLSTFLSGIVMLQTCSYSAGTGPCANDNDNDSIGQNKIVYLHSGDKLVYISNENIAPLIDQLKEVRDGYREAELTGTEAFIMAGVITIAGAAATVSGTVAASKKILAKKDWSNSKKLLAGAGLSLATHMGVSASFFCGEEVATGINKVIRKSAHDFEYSIFHVCCHTRDIARHRARHRTWPNTWPRELSLPRHLDRQIGTDTGISGLINVLESISPELRHRSRHGQIVNLDFFDPLYTDRDHGIILHLYKTLEEDNYYDVRIYGQGDCTANINWRSDNAPPVVEGDSLILDGLSDFKPEFRNIKSVKPIERINKNLITQIIS